jgi:prepilin-type N-terminal cleavage/methylation domain-containing protein
MKQNKGVTLIELLIALVLSAILIAGIYRVFIHQHKSYATQEQVADMQQNVRVAINRMIREIRMAGFGGKNENVNGNNDIISVFGNVNGFTNIINAENNVVEARLTHDRIAVVSAHDQIATLQNNAAAGSNSFRVNFTKSTRFDKPWRKYICLNGRNNYAIIPTNTDTLTLEGGATLNENHSAGEPIFIIRAIRYGLRVDGNGIPVLFRDLYPNTSDTQRDTIAEYVEDLRFRYVLVDTPPNTPWENLLANPAKPQDIRGVMIRVQTRTRLSDPELKDGSGGFRRRTLNTYVDLRNLRD